MQHADQVREHARWRQGWSSGRTSYAWLIPLGAEPKLRELANQYQYALRDLPGFDPVPLEWMHILLQEVGFTDEVQPASTEPLLEAARERLAGKSTPSLTFQDAVVLSESLALPAEPQAELAHLRSTLRDATASIVSESAMQEPPEEIDQHVSLAYSTAEGPAIFAAATLDATEVGPVKIEIPGVSLVQFTRDHSSSEWSTIDRITFG